MPCPAFAVARRGEQPIDDLGPGLERLISEEGLEFRDRGRQTRDIEGDAPQQGRAVGERRRGKTFRQPPGGKEAIGGAIDPTSGKQPVGWVGAGQGLERPVRLLAGREIELVDLFACACARLRHGRLWPRAAPANPLANRFDLLLGQFGLGRHLVVAGVLDDFDKQARQLFAFDGRTAVAAGQQRGATIESQSALLLRIAMAGLTLLDQQRPDF